MSETVFVRVEVLGRLPSGKVEVKLIADGTDGIKPFYTREKDLIYLPSPQPFHFHQDDTPSFKYDLITYLDDQRLKWFLEESAEEGNEVISISQAGDLFSVLYRRCSLNG